MHYIIYGAGGIGATIGARLYQAGRRVTLVARGEHGDVLRERGLCFVSPEERVQLPIPAVTHPSQIALDQHCVVMLCVKSQHTLAALTELAACADPTTAVVCVQNGVHNETLALRYFANTYAMVVNLPTLFLTPGEVVTYAQGRGGVLDMGCFPQGTDSRVKQVTSDITDSGFSAKPDPTIMRQKYAKLLMNLGNVLQAGLRDVAAASDCLRWLKKEALACYAAAGIDCATREETRARTEGVYQLVDVSGYSRTAGSSWQSLKRGGDLETDYLNGEIVWMGRRYGVATPANSVCVNWARELVTQGMGPARTAAADLIERIELAKVQIQQD